mmetsp:Transcript_17139/g.31020  ORF Transcript_17139/g.31020 Transcript_17139/m.31020 type:complete len:179 (-) Transcript_17139:409-945(-)
MYTWNQADAHHLQIMSTRIKVLPQQVNATVAPNAQAIKPIRPQMTDDIQSILTCCTKISGDIMRDPVILFPSGKTFDRKPLCKWLLHNPTPRCPWTNEPLDRHMTYVENRDTCEILFRYLGEAAYKRYDDTDFKTQYQALWNAHFAGVPFNVGATYQDDYQFDSVDFSLQCWCLLPRR